VPRASVIVPIFNGITLLPTFFDSLTAALPDGSELVLVDDGSTEPVWEAVPDFPSVESLLRLRNDANLGYSVAVNRAFAATTGEVVVQLNTDLILHPECITAMIDLIQREEGVGIVGSILACVGHCGSPLGRVARVCAYEFVHKTLVWDCIADHPSQGGVVR
jgi:glycosyltransferase involved in cell wall biosynthesis